MQETILKMIQELSPYGEYDENTNLIDEGILDSLTLVLLIEKLEKEFSVSVPGSQLDPENFETVVKMAEFITSLQ